MSVLIYPVQLYDLKEIPDEWKSFTFYLLEEPIYWGTEKDFKLNQNQLKLVLHRSSMKYYQKQLNSKGFRVKYIEEKDLSKDGYKFLKKEKSDKVFTYDPTDHLLVKKIKRETKKYKKEIEMVETPNFLLTKEDLNKYIDTRKKMKGHNHAHFYTWSKKTLKLDKVIGSKTYDTENRQPLPKEEIKFPKLPKDDRNTSFVKEAIKYISKNYGKNYGDASKFWLPITHKSSEAWFRKFLTDRFSKFGKFQDAITSKNAFLYHSVITPMLNIGLLDPKWVVDQTVAYYKKKKVAKNNFEGYLRQIIGWREYSRMLYLHAYEEIKGNHFGHQRKLTKAWYDGTTGIKPIDWTINTAFETGYLHHILRLMMMANFMNLVGLHPDQIFKWFMEFSLDSYSWVMHNNVYSMGTYADGGLTMRKPYLSSSNYILKMSDFKKDKHWEEIWTDLFYNFLIEHEKKLKGTPYLRNLAYYKKKSKSEQKDLRSRAQKFIRQVTD